MHVPADLQARTLRTRAPTHAYFAAAKISAAERVTPSDAATWCEVIRRLELPMLLALATTYNDPLPFVAFVRVVRMHRSVADSKNLRDADARITNLAEQMLELQGLGSVLRVDDVVAATPRVVGVVRGELPEMALAPRLRK